MRLLNRLPITQKILGAILTSLLFLALLLGFIIWESLTKMMTEDLEKRGISIANNIASASSDYILMDDHYSIHLLISQIKQANEDVRYIMIINSNGAVIGHTFADYLPKGILNAHIQDDTNIGITTLTSDEGNIHDILVPIEQGDVGVVRVGMTEKIAKSYILFKIVQLVLATLIVCMVAAGIAYYVTVFITKPINSLVDTAIGISEGNLSLRATVVGNDEVGQLAQAFNEMTDNLINSRNKVEILLQKLQEKDYLRDELIIKLLSAQEDERKRISRELHDETSQALASLMITMRVLANDAQDKEQQNLLNTCRDITAGILQEIREIAVELRPPIIDDIGLIPAVHKYVKEFEEKHSIGVKLLFFEPETNSINNQVALTLYRIIQESLTNVVKHAFATNITIRMWEINNSVNLTILDNGQGILETDSKKAYQQNRIGIHGMKERAELLGGTFAIKTKETGGTKVMVSIPLIQKEGTSIEKNN
jgi:signal transduction histidine kinase